MYVTALRASGYRNLDGLYRLCHPLAVIVGENNAGKSNVIDGLRSVLEAEAGPRARSWLTVDDFHHADDGVRDVEELALEVQLSELTDRERGRMVTCLAPSLGPNCARIRLRATLGADGRVLTQYVGGDSDVADVERHARDAVRFTYLPPLRDAVADLQPGRDNRLVALLNALLPEGDADRDEVVATVERLNTELQDIEGVKRVKSELSRRLDRLTGAGRYQQTTDLAFSDPRFERIIGSLRAQIGRTHPLEMTEGGLGFNNLLYMAVLLAALAEPPDADSLRVLLIEEPEAHLHPQLQDLLMRFLEEESGDGTQVIVTSHSPTFASAARVERLTVLAEDEDGVPVGRRPVDFGLTSKQSGHLRRFLDVTKAALFFAKAVVLVEGVAEQLLLPVIAERLGRTLAKEGVAVINIGGVAFRPFTDLFGPDNLPYPVAVVSDDDRQPSAEDLEGGEPRLSPRAEQLRESANESIRVCLAPRTLEWALVEAGNKDLMLRALALIKPRVAARLSDELQEAGPAEAADALLAAVEDVKGQFAQELADLIADPDNAFVTPQYLVDAIDWVTMDETA